MRFAENADRDSVLEWRLDTLACGDDTGLSGLYVVVWFAGPDECHCWHSELMSGWLYCERRIAGSGGASAEDVMLSDGMRVRRRGGGARSSAEAGPCACTGSTWMESDAETVAASAMAENVERRRAREGRFGSEGRAARLRGGGV